MKKIVTVLIFIACMLAISGCQSAADNPQGSITGAVDTPQSSITEAVEKGPTTMNIYEEFLAGKELLYNNRFQVELPTPGGDYEVLYNDAGVDITTFVQNISLSFLNDSYAPLNLLSYAFLDCGNDGEPELALRLESDDGNWGPAIRLVVLKVFDGQLQLCYYAESGYRTSEELRGSNGLIVRSGSNSAYSSGNAYSLIDGNGEYHKICTEEYVYGLENYYAEGNRINETAAKYSADIPEDILLRITCFYQNNESIRTEMFSTDQSDNETVQKIFKEAGVTLSSDEEIDAVIAEKLKEYQLEMVSEKPEWRVVYQRENALSYRNLDFSSLPEKKSPECIPNVIANEKYAMVVYSVPGMDSSEDLIAVYSFEENGVTGTKDFGISNNRYTLCEDCFYVLDEMNGTLDKYNFLCEKLSSTKFSEGNAFGAYYSPEMDRIFYFDVTGKIKLYDVEKETAIDVDMENRLFNCIGTVDERIIVSTYDNTIMAVDKDGAVENLYGNHSARVANACIGACIRGDYIVFLPLQGGPLNMAHVRSNSEIISSAYGKYIVSVTQEEKDTVFVYDTINMKCTSIKTDVDIWATAIVKNGVILAAVSDEQGNITCDIFFEEDGTTEDIAKEAYEQDIVDGIIELPEVSGSDAMVKTVTEMLEKYNVRLLYDTELFGDDLFGYEIVDDEEKAILDRIDEITAFFDSLPKGLVNEAGGGRPLLLYVCKEISGSVQGLNTAIGGYNVIYVESSGTDWYFGSILAHEFGHALERNVSRKLVEGWVDLMPEDIVHTYQTEGGTNLTIEYTTEDGGRTPVWFVSSYGRTNEAEDRATVFESMYNVHNHNEMKVLEYENLTKKVRYWEKMLIETYDSCTEDTIFSWNQ